MTRSASSSGGWYTNTGLAASGPGANVKSFATLAGALPANAQIVNSASGAGGIQGVGVGAAAEELLDLRPVRRVAHPGVALALAQQAPTAVEALAVVQVRAQPIAIEFRPAIGGPAITRMVNLVPGVNPSNGRYYLAGYTIGGDAGYIGAAKKFPNESAKGIGFYAVRRTMQMRRWRLPKPLVGT